MPKPRPTFSSGEKNLISQRLVELRKEHNLSQRELAHKLQLIGYDMDKNVITRTETNMVIINQCRGMYFDTPPA